MAGLLDSEEAGHGGAPPAPFMKWVGGKRQLLPELFARLPKRVGGTYYEPFVGGGALFFALAARGALERAVLADRNPELVEAYQVVRDDPEALMAALDGHVNEKEHYYRVRAQERGALTLIGRAARTLYLNRCGFNGLYRVNSKGGFNVPFGDNPGKRLYRREWLLAASKALRLAELRHVDFEEACAEVKRGDLVYFDPPYVPLSVSSAFTSYTSEGFGYEEQVRLRDLALRLKKRGAQVLLSNSSAPLVRELYAEGFVCEEVAARRAVNSVAAKRGVVVELVIR